MLCRVSYNNIRRDGEEIIDWSSALVIRTVLSVFSKYDRKEWGVWQDSKFGLFLKPVQYIFIIQNRCCNRRKTEMKKWENHIQATLQENNLESFGEIRKKQKKKTRLQTYDLYDIFVHCCICWKRAAHGEGFSMTSRTGKLCVTTTYSSNRTRTASACLIKSCKNWSRQKEKSIRDADTAREKGYDAGKNLRNKAAYRSLCHGASSRNLYDNR